MKADSVRQREKIVQILKERGIDADIEYMTGAILIPKGESLYAFGTASGEDWGYNDEMGDDVGQLNIPINEQSPKYIADRIAEVIQQEALPFGESRMAATKNEAIEAAEKFKLRANAARVKKAALDAVAAHEKKAAPGDPEEPEQDVPMPEPEPEPEPEPNEVERTEPATDPAPEPLPPVTPPEMDVVQPPPPVEISEETEEVDEEAEDESPEVLIRAEVEAEISDPETVEATMEFLRESDYMDARLTVKEGVWGWREASNFATIEIGSMEFMIAPSHDAAEKFAEAMVKQQLNDEPELFTQDWLEGYINDERLRDALSSDVEEQVRQSPDSYGWEPEEVDEDDEDAEEPSDEPSDDWIEDKVQEILKDPVQYCKDIFGDAEGMKFAMEHGGINVNEAAEDAVAADGPGHFLSSYDGELRDLPSGGVWWRHN